MTNTLAIWIIILIAAFLVGDAVLFEGANALFLARKFAGVLTAMAFWR